MVRVTLIHGKEVPGTRGRGPPRFVNGYTLK